MDFAQLLQDITVNAIPLLLAITLHEAAHGYAARQFGDNTAAMLGRITLNPVKHIDLIGTILLPLLLYLSTSGAVALGYAKPVPVNFGNLRNPKRDMVWVALAGPGANFFQAVFWMTLLYLLRSVGVTEQFFLAVANAGIAWNLLMFAFNLFPLPPLDGGRILVGLLPWKQAELVSRIEPYGFFVVIALVVTGIISSLWMYPLMGVTQSAIELLLTPLRALLF